MVEKRVGKGGRREDGWSSEIERLERRTINIIGEKRKLVERRNEGIEKE